MRIKSKLTRVVLDLVTVGNTTANEKEGRRRRRLTLAPLKYEDPVLYRYLPLLKCFWLT